MDNINNVCVGDLVEVCCVDRRVVDTSSAKQKVFKGRVVSLFNAFDKEGDNWFVEIKGEHVGWFLYKPRIDGGTITVLKKG